MELLRLVLGVAVLAAPIPLARRLARRLDDGEHTLVGLRALSVVLVWCALQVGLGIALGLVHLLNTPAVVPAEAAVLALGLWRGRGGSWHVGRLDTGDAVLATVVAVAVATFTWSLLSVPTRNFDSLAYHLPAVVQWVQTGHLTVAEELGNAARYPYSWEMVGTLAVLPVGSDVLVALPNLMGWALLGLAILVLAQQLGAEAGPAKVAAVLALCVPSVLSRLEAIQPDIALAGCFLACMVYIDRARFAARGGPLLGLALSLGLLIGTKTSGLGYAVVALVFLGGPAAWARRRDRGLRWEGVSAVGWVAAAVAVLLIGGVWYIRNLIFTGNPLGFFRVELFGTEVFAGSVGRAELHPTTLAAIFQFGRGEHWRILLEALRSWMGVPLLVFLVAPWMVLPDLRRRPHRICRRLLVGIMASCAAALLVYWNTPFSGDNGQHGLQLTPWIYVGFRYAYPALALLAVLSAAGFTVLQIPTRVLLVIAVMGGVLGVVWTNPAGAWASRIAVGVGSGAILVLHRGWISLRVASAGLFAGLIVVATVALPIRHQARARWYGGMDEYLHSLPNQDLTVGYAGTVRRYPLYGRAWSRRAIATDPGLGKAVWLAQLRQAGVTLLVIPTGSRESWEHRDQVLGWIEEQPQGFELVYQSETARHDLAVFRVSLP